MVKESKKILVEEIKQKISAADLIMFSQYKGLTVADDHELRRSIHSVQGEYCVYKNTLVALAFKDLQIPVDEKQLTGPTAYIFAKEPVAPAKALAVFCKEHDSVTVKGGVFQKQAIGAADIKELAALPSQKDLLAKLVYLLQSPITGLVNVVQGPLRKLVYALNAVAEKKPQ
ncbi:50S ribosomal protein L10 [Candidatus Termititenax persephonae]|uniref:Large ribosomal subunit protein uL10 n=1 Tax=Candidatus Termititenax persephonae TaxID=2218525 RepID=A0A388TEL6_9BACT|nr:50S ribosomal protein L10 [Candidatus Termititenax persephonae]